MTFETISLLLSWVQLGVLLAIFSRLGRTFDLIASTQRELRRAIHHLGEHRAAGLGISDQISRWGPAPPAPAHIEDADDLASQSQ